MHTSQHVTRPLILVPLHQKLAVLRVFILKVKDIESGTALVSAATLRLYLLDLNLMLVPSALLVHKLPPFHVTVILLHSIHE